MAEERAALHMTECNQETFSFASHFSRRVEASFTAGQVTAASQQPLFHIGGQPAKRSYAANPASIRNQPFGTPAEPIAEPIASRLTALHPCQNPPLATEPIRVRNGG